MGTASQWQPIVTLREITMDKLLQRGISKMLQIEMGTPSLSYYWLILEERVRHAALRSAFSNVYEFAWQALDGFAGTSRVLEITRRTLMQESCTSAWRAEG